MDGLDGIDGGEADDGELPSRPIRHPQPVRHRPRHGGSILMAAMLGLAEALGMDPEPTLVVQPANPSGDDGFDLDYGGLPPLN